MGFADMKAGRDLDALALAEAMRQIESSLERGARLRQSAHVFKRHVERGLSSLIHADLSSQGGLIGESNALLDSNLGSPQPEIPGAGEGRNSDLRQGIRLARRNDRLVLAEKDAGVLPIDIQSSHTQSQQMIE